MRKQAKREPSGIYAACGLLSSGSLIPLCGARETIESALDDLAKEKASLNGRKRNYEVVIGQRGNGVWLKYAEAEPEKKTRKKKTDG